MAEGGAFGGDHRGLRRAFGPEAVVDRRDAEAHPHVARPAVREGEHRHAVPPARYGEADDRREVRPEKQPHPGGEPVRQAVGRHEQPRLARALWASATAGLPG
jgi:hypothetical protein